MKNAKKVGVEAAVWKVGSAEEFLSLSDADIASAFTTGAPGTGKARKSA